MGVAVFIVEQPPTSADENLSVWFRNVIDTKP